MKLVDTVVCDQCEGEGKVQVYNFEDAAVPLFYTCEDCLGSGVVNKKAYLLEGDPLPTVCPSCNGVVLPIIYTSYCATVAKPGTILVHGGHHNFQGCPYGECSNCKVSFVTFAEPKSQTR